MKLDFNLSNHFPLEDYHIVRYGNGNAYYLLPRYSAMYRNPNAIFHLLSGDAYDGANSVQAINWEDIPLSYRLDAIALNPVVRDWAKRKDMFKKPYLDKLLEVVKPELLLLAAKERNPQTVDTSGSLSTISKPQNDNNMSFLSNIPGLNLNFGQLEAGRIAISMSGEPAFKNKNGEYVTVTVDEDGVKQRVDVGSLKLDVDFYKVPTQTLESGDIVLLDNELLIVESTDDGNYKFINPITGNRSSKLQRTNILGMYFYTKIVSLFDLAGNQGGVGLNGLNPLTLALLSDGKNQFGASSFVEMMVLSQMTGADGTMNPMLMMALAGNGGSSNGDLLKFMMFAQASGGANPFGNMFAKKQASATAVVAKKATTASRRTVKKK